MAKKYLIETFGCQMNFHDSERMAGLLEQAGYESTSDSQDADVVVINTCSVRERAEDKLYSRLGELRAEAIEQGRRPVLAVTGCVAQQEGATLRRRSRDIDVIVGTQSLKMLPMLVDRAAQEKAEQRKGALRIDIDPHEDVSFPLGIARRSDPVKAYVTIVEGCNDFCTFCVVPYTRGHERMRPAREILEEVTEAAASGRREIQLLGQIVNHYQAPDDPAIDFPELLGRVSRIDGVERVRFASPHPRHVTQRLIEAIRDIPQVCKHLHLPVQSGSTAVLKAMRRRYTRESYLELVDRVRAAVPGIALSTDMIVGFPGESAADFKDTLSLVERVRFHSMFSFKYSPRPNTLAHKRMSDDVGEEEKGRRLGALQALQRDVQLELHERAVGQRFEVLVDATSRKRDWELSGRTTGNTVVNFPGRPGWLGSIVRVEITEAGPNSLRGTAGSDAD
ncbi:MAG TPA: tRNA (N6-isopentenyl adenosine(37)-C2)-methylthiotransferase MiaB [Vicinamibacterales bacterium]|nr:tRNA (N6-isopentenyl adenosine(37)-C2)-methylthiotransferase MiaB [Vicinamibacterales bacterium]